MLWARRVFGIAFLIWLTVTAAFAGEAEDRKLLKDLLSSNSIPLESFTQSFLEAVPEARLRAALKPFRRDYGKVQRVGQEGERYMVWTDSHKIPVTLGRNLAGKIHTLFFHTPVRLVANLEADLSVLAKLPGKVAYMITKNGKPLAARGEDEPLAVGSAFKLALLAALKDKIDRGEAKWEDVVRLKAKHKSLPSGILQDMPTGAPLTLHSVAALMVARSDNTATDLLIDYLGRAEPEKLAGIAPMLTTAELFKLRKNPKIYKRYASANLTGRRGILKEVESLPLPDGYDKHIPFLQQGEWFIPAKKLCALIKSVANLDVMQINPGPAGRSDWSSVAYKGGSETGVLNLTTQVTGKNGSQFCVVATWNDRKPLQERKLISAYGTLLKSLANLRN